jgi:DNA-directed RNA polymerase sigma subunit (sigma70/sigma32)
MLHYKTTQKNEHYGVSYNYEYILVQLQSAIEDRIEQVRIPLTIEEAEHMMQLLQKAIESHKECKIPVGIHG